MNRQECETAITEKLREIVEIYHGYHPEGRYLSLMYMDNENGEYLQFNNRYWSADGPAGENGEDVETPIDYHTQEVSA